MITKDNPKSSKKFQIFRCEKCDYNTSRMSQYTRHLATLKHQNNENDNKMITKSSKKFLKNFVCSCGKSYKYASNLCRHEKTCQLLNINLQNEPTSNNQQHKIDKLLDVVMEQQKTLNEVVKKMNDTGNTTNSYNTNNITFQLYLDNKCKDAVCLDDFTKNLTMKIDDIMSPKILGFGGVGNVVVKNLQEMKIEDRPIHCMDVKNAKYYIKNEEGWEEDNGKSIEKVLIRAKSEIIRELSNIWDEEYGSSWPKNDVYSSTYMDTVRIITSEPAEKDKIKMIKNIGESVYVKVSKLLEDM
jgi:hypothetical protein